MREFRAWDKFNEVMVYSKDFKNLAEYFAYCQKCIDGDNEIIQMQRTGLKDKNGVESNEGDIVSLVDCEPSLYKIVWWENNFKYGVEYIGSDKTNWQEENLEEFSSDLIEVIGNIWENPELLKEDNC